MKLQFKIILIPVCVVISALLINMLVVESHIENLMLTPAIPYIESIMALRWYFLLSTVITVAIVLCLSWLILGLIKSEVQKEKNIQEQRLIQRTREITLIQTMSTMLNSVHCIDDAARVLHTIIPKLLPSLSGAVFLVKDNEQEMIELTYWGQDWPSDSRIISAKCWQEKHITIKGQITTSNTACSATHCPFNGYAMCVSLVSEEVVLGTIHFISKQQVLSDEIRIIATNLAEQISFALSNLHLKDKLRRQAIRDPLTGLYNRRFMMEAFEPALHRAERHEKNLAVLMLDLDYFKNFNDHFGHKAGDIVLTQVAELFKSNLRLEDIACRYGGEEFFIICPDTNLRDAYVLAEKLLTCINQLSISYEGQNLGTITSSVGVAIYPNHALSTQQLIIQADKALYAAKNRGRNCAVVAQANTRYYQNV